MQILKKSAQGFTIRVLDLVVPKGRFAYFEKAMRIRFQIKFLTSIVGFIFYCDFRSGGRCIRPEGTGGEGQCVVRRPAQPWLKDAGSEAGKDHMRGCTMYVRCRTGRAHSEAGLIAGNRSVKIRNAISKLKT
ncbi:MAG: hypothetical protein AB7S99_18240 [Pseudodonghicola sp.]